MAISGGTTDDAESFDDAAERLLGLAERAVRESRRAGRDRLRVAAEWHSYTAVGRC